MIANRRQYFIKTTNKDWDEREEDISSQAVVLQTQCISGVWKNPSIVGHLRQ